MKEYKRILIVKMSSLGDVIHALPTLYAIRKNWPNAHITWAVHEQFSGPLPGKPWIDEVLFIDKKKLKSLRYLWSLRKVLHSHMFDMCLDLQCLAKSAIVAALSGAKEKYGYWELREGSQLINKALVGPNKYGHVIERYLDTVRALGGEVTGVEFPINESPEAAASCISKLTDAGLPQGHDYVVMAPGARWAVKEWPISSFGALANRLAEAKQYVVLIGAKGDKAKAQAIKDKAKSEAVFDMTGETSLEELIELIRGAKLFISADTGPLHIANALKRPLIGLYGTTSPERTGPYGGDYVHCIVSPTSKATPENPLVDDPDCMSQISVDQVWATAKTLL
ncbi:glycosyltransferase family 9 protein [Veillonella criceti]|uniref:Lipopolysaccharide core heptosyltransferase rfaQ n=1 Tax=Veillonella criceti TaxID=103891 RepID=A0A380NH43_9FIRM|nr:glycosyltransferase family 9 protein [Veillonella criceti]SUP40324.1 Lipopolysaccharide core heptosyltransferase rfaQ [Veillonella criceti]